MAKFIILSIFIIYLIILVPLQYHNLVATKKELRESGKRHNDHNEDVSFEQQQLQYNLQGNLFNLPATLVAMLIYRVRHGEW
ncbi:DUF3949 domain-containing protein [Ornithinibacillus sp. L9]|uniref:DUF3949 domain-containing protein n=1 Tax=Ornithinibacillus caprae TaxID=2678566 RepID=A0A6N8FIP8_9BACI|nr:DUF3949 domain-containing protein [Ornithinibacillus caprae]MUK88556.1 DUF3949 domain-containing protein [Ornithinibacillus caprae]